MSFILDTREGAYVFPCSVCKNREGRVELCKSECWVYAAQPDELFDLKNNINAMIKERDK